MHVHGGSVQESFADASGFAFFFPFFFHALL
jgi:hypothetical protein